MTFDIDFDAHGITLNVVGEWEHTEDGKDFLNITIVRCQGFILENFNRESFEEAYRDIILKKLYIRNKIKNYGK